MVANSIHDNSDMTLCTLHYQLAFYQHVLVFPECPGAADIALVLDVSGSMPQERFSAVKDFLVQLLEQFELWSGTVRVAIVSFSDNARVETYLNSFATMEDNLEVVRRVPYRGGKTNIADALRVTRQRVFTGNGDRTNVQVLTSFMNYHILWDI